MSEPSFNGSSDFIQLYTASTIKFNIRFSHYMSKINECLINIADLLQDSNDVDVEETVIHREKRIAAEFARRFSRNNLYSIQLKLTKAEKEIAFFFSKTCCKIAQALSLQTIILSVVKKLSDSVQLYVQFLRKSKTRTATKLNEIINYVLHFHEIVQNVVDCDGFQAQNVKNACSTILNLLRNLVIPTPSLNTTRTGKCWPQVALKPLSCTKSQTAAKFNCKKPECQKSSNRNRIQKLVPKKEFNQADDTRNLNIQKQEVTIKPSDLKNALYTEITSTANTPIGCGDEFHAQVKMNEVYLMRFKIADICSRVCDSVLTDLVNEVSQDVAECLEKLAIDTFNIELCLEN